MGRRQELHENGHHKNSNRDSEEEEEEEVVMVEAKEMLTETTATKEKAVKF